MSHELSVTIDVDTPRGRKYVNVKGSGYKDEDEARAAHAAGKNPSLDGKEYDDPESAVAAAKARSDAHGASHSHGGKRRAAQDILK